MARTLEEIAEALVAAFEDRKVEFASGRAGPHTHDERVTDTLAALTEVREGALEEVARMVDHDEDIPAAFAARIRTLASRPEPRCESCGHLPHGVYCLDTSSPVHCRCKAGMRG